MKIKSVRISDFRGLKFADFEPSEHIVAIYGKNGAGKSSVLDAIFSTIAGANSFPEAPVRSGCDEAECSVVLSNGVTVTRKWSSSGKSVLEVNNPFGYKQDRPQSYLSSLFSQIAFDPLSFSDLPPKEQAKQLISVAGIDDEVRKINDEIKEIQKKRKDLKYAIEEKKKKIDSIRKFGVSGDYDTSVFGDSSESKTINKIKDDIYEAKVGIDSAEEEIASLEYENEEIGNEIELKKIEINELEVSLGSNLDEICKLKSEIRRLSEISKSLNTKFDQAVSEFMASCCCEYIDRMESEISSIMNSDEENRSRIKSLEDEMVALSDKANEKLGIMGIEFSGDGALYCGMNIKNLSTAEKIKIGIFIAEACQKPLNVIYARDASLLDEESMQELFDFAKEKDAQIFIERVGVPERDDVIVIEDGFIKPPNKNHNSGKNTRDLPGQMTFFDCESSDKEENPF